MKDENRLDDIKLDDKNKEIIENKNINEEKLSERNIVDSGEELDNEFDDIQTADKQDEEVKTEDVEKDKIQTEDIYPVDEKLEDIKTDDIQTDEVPKDPRKQSKGSAILEWAKSILIAVVLALLIKTFIVESSRIRGNSMNMTLQNDDKIIIDKIGMKLKALERGDVVVLKYDNSHDFIKRVVGLPGEYIQVIDGKVYINGEVYEEDYIYGESTQAINGSEWKLGKNEFFVMGDNRTPGGSTDSRVFGPVKLDQIKGKAVFRFYPFNNMGAVK